MSRSRVWKGQINISGTNLKHASGHWSIDKETIRTCTISKRTTKGSGMVTQVQTNELMENIKADRNFIDNNLLDYHRMQPVMESQHTVKAKGVTVKSHPS